MPPSPGLDGGLLARWVAGALANVNGGWTRSAEVRDPQGAELTLSQFTPPGD
ncbi:MAG TPA: hypothetical protein VHJ39_02250 [Solirubrobacteraceae bacterium]|nr:hypothetical protein [Solirubrobacteraceae bacterium]